MPVTEYIVKKKCGCETYRDKNVEYHRDNGPAIVLCSGVEEWHSHGKYHREDGPAFITETGEERYFLWGIEISKEMFQSKSIEEIELIFKMIDIIET